MISTVKEPTITINDLVLSDHAQDSIYERTGVENKKQQLNLIKKLMKKANFIDITLDEFGKEAYMFGCKHENSNWVIHIGLNLKTIVTFYQPERVSYDPLKKQTIELHKKELRKVNRSISAYQRKMKRDQDDFNVERAELIRRKNRTRSSNVRKQCVEALNEIDYKEMEQQDNLRKLQKRKTRIARSLAYVY